MGQILIVCHNDFTQVNRNILFYKIEKSGCTGRLIDTLRILYSKTRYRVKCNGEISDIIWENVDVNQGGNASTILFRSYLSDIEDYLDEYTGICIFNEIILHMLWADDLYMVSCNADHAQRQLDGLSKFCAPNQMVIKEFKTKMAQVQSYKCLSNIISSTKTVTGLYFEKIMNIYLKKQGNLPLRCWTKQKVSTVTVYLLYVPKCNKTDSSVWYWYLANAHSSPKIAR